MSTCTEMKLRVVPCPDETLSTKNGAVVSKENARLGDANYVLINGRYPMKVEISDKVGADDIGFNGKQREWVNTDKYKFVTAKEFKVDQSVHVTSMTVEIDYYGKLTPKDPVNTDELSRIFINRFTQLKTLFCIGQKVTLSSKSVPFQNFPTLEGIVTDLKLKGELPTQVEGVKKHGIIAVNSLVYFQAIAGSTITLTGSKIKQISPEWDFSTKGVGGLQKEFDDIFRRAFSSRVFPPKFVSDLAMKHVRGILLYGPPGTGKTLMARQIGKMLGAKEPTIINGPEVLNKFVGESEKAIRELFDEAKKDKQNQSGLHIIIFDEIDAICRQRGSLSGSTGVNDTVVNQLLAMIDGVEQLNNILLIGMTNRKDMIDEALLRPGRLEVQIEINLPNEDGRKEILEIHTKKLRESGKLKLGTNDISELAKKTRNFSGAELEGLVRSATSTAMDELIKGKGKDKVEISEEEAENLKVTLEHFEQAQRDIKPAFGTSEEELKKYIKNGILKWGPVVTEILTHGEKVKQQVKESSMNFLSSMLLHGPRGAGKTALAVHLAQDDAFPFVKVISPKSMIGYSENAKCQMIKKVFDDAYKSPLSCIVMDNIERLFDYVSIGPRFSNLVLQAIQVLLCEEPPPGHRLLVLGTTSLPDETLESLGIKDAFQVSLFTPCLCKSSEVVSALKEWCEVVSALKEGNTFHSEQLTELNKKLEDCEIDISIKKLLALADAATQQSDTDSVQELIEML